MICHRPSPGPVPRAKTTLDTYGHIWPDRDEPTRDVRGRMSSPPVVFRGYTAKSLAEQIREHEARRR